MAAMAQQLERNSLSVFRGREVILGRSGGEAVEEA